MNLYFVVLRSFVLPPNSKSKLIHNRFTSKLIIKTTAAYVHAREQLRLCIVNREDWLGSPAKHQSNKQRCQDLCWKVQDPAQSFVFPSYNMHELRNQHFSIGQFLSSE